MGEETTRASKGVVEDVAKKENEENGVEPMSTEGKHVPAADAGMDEELKAEEEEHRRVDALLKESEARDVVPEDEIEAPTLLRAGGSQLDIKRNVSEDQKQEQLETLLSKAQQYSNFIVRSQLGEKAPEASSLAVDEDNAATASTEEATLKKRKRSEEDAAKYRAKAAKQHDPSAKSKKQVTENSMLVEQPSTMIGGTLKGYQVEGLRWLATLYENGLSGILADEMGLGKTIQVIALVAHLREKNVVGPIIIAAPLATLPNWTKEFRKWVPSIKCIQYHGSKQWRAQQRREVLQFARQRNEDFPVIITSYEVCITDRAALSKFDFSYLVVDEGQRVKNRDCRLVRELKKLRSQNRLLLSGTPIQNTLEELWSLLNFVNPDIFDDLQVFQSWFGFRNIGKETQVNHILDQESQQRIVTKLHEILRPFLLRRVKSDVLAHLLPPKQEIVVYVPMSTIQQKFAAQIDAGHLRDTLLASGVSTARDISEQNNMMNHRKNANHPFLFGEPRTQQGDYVTTINPRALAIASGKFALLERMLPKLKAAGHKVLIFSQMTELLNLLEDFLTQIMGYRTFRIDGSVNLDERQRQIEEFNSEPVGQNELFIFMLSTRAGGLGINLASADTCIIFDSDWNPQQDSQAQDRCHRIGQTRPVVAYRLLTAGSVEIDMMEKQIAKKKLERMAITGGDFKRAGMRSHPNFSVDNLRHLLSDDVNMAQRLLKSSTSTTETAIFDQPQITDEELELILDRTHIFHETSPIPAEGAMYDVVKGSGGAQADDFFSNVK